MQISVKNIDKLGPAIKRKVMLAAQKALAKTANDAREAVKREIRDVFDRPTPWIVNSVRQRIDADGLAAEIYISNQDYSSGEIRSASGAVSPANVLRPHISGGGRILKNSEMLLRRLGVLGGGQYIVPGPGAPLDAYGNISRGDMVKILSAAGLLSGAGYSGSATARSRSRNRGAMRGVYCIPRVGIFQHGASSGSGNRRWATKHGGPSVPLIFFANKKPEYEAGRFDMAYAVTSTAKTVFPKYFAQFMEK